MLIGLCNRFHSKSVFVHASGAPIIPRTTVQGTSEKRRAQKLRVDGSADIKSSYLANAVWSCPSTRDETV
jgi:hypothetical protein